MVSKEEFVNTLEELKKTDELQRKIDDLIRDASHFTDILDFVSGYGFVVTHDAKVVELLDNMFDTDMVSYWVYELDYGKEYKEGCVSEADGTIINIETASDLYEYITKPKITNFYEDE